MARTSLVLGLLVTALLSACASGDGRRLDLPRFPAPAPPVETLPPVGS